MQKLATKNKKKTEEAEDALKGCQQVIEFHALRGSNAASNEMRKGREKKKKEHSRVREGTRERANGDRETRDTCEENAALETGDCEEEAGEGAEETAIHEGESES